MEFTPCSSEANAIGVLQKIRSSDFVLLRLTSTMIEKNNLDANELFRAMLYNYGIADYNLLPNGGKNGVEIKGTLILPEGAEIVRIKFYKVNNKRGDRRFSIETIQRKKRSGAINVGDLLYISAYRADDGEAKLFIINLTNSTPCEAVIRSAIGADLVTAKLEELKPRLREIVNAGFHDNINGHGPIAPKDVGETLESLLDIRPNNDSGADIDGLIEIKAKRAKTLDTLFTLRPQFAETETANYEADDKKRVSAFTRLYGYDSARHPDSSCLYITIGSKERPQNKKGFYLEVSSTEPRVYIMRVPSETQQPVAVAYWEFAELRDQLLKKHPATLWFQAVVKEKNMQAQFAYKNITFTRAPQFTIFLSLIQQGIVTYNWRGYTTKNGEYEGKNHGNAWRIKPSARAQLFGTAENLDVL